MRTVLLVLLAGTTLAAAPMTDGERQRLIAHLDMTENWLVSELDGLSEAQVNFRMSPESWTIAEVVEHLSIAEPQYWKQEEDALKQPATAYKSESTDAAILWYGIDRTNRTKTGEARVPGGRAPAKQSLASFRKLRATMMQMAKTSQDDFRGRKLLDGNMDTYQWLLMISTHAQRHILQIKEIKAHPKYPRA
jgi:DinB family protein